MLILNGELDPVWFGQIDKKFAIYCTDGAYERIKALPCTVQAVIGDLDSLSDKSRGEVKLIHRPSQNYTDFEKALQYLLDRYKKIDIYGASGGDVDHFIGNLSVAKKYKDAAELVFIEPKQYYFFMNNKTELENVRGKTISILPFPKVENIKSIGLEYELHDTCLEFGELVSLRNRAKADRVNISFSRGCALLCVSY